MVLPKESVVHGSQASQHPSDTPDPDHELVQPQQLPALDRLLRQHGVAALVQEHGHTLVAAEARALLAALRARPRRARWAPRGSPPAAWRSSWKIACASAWHPPCAACSTSPAR